MLLYNYIINEVFKFQSFKWTCNLTWKSNSKFVLKNEEITHLLTIALSCLKFEMFGRDS